jgi:hypothetical protein
MRRRDNKVTKASGLFPVLYDCCENSCMAFTGDNSDLTHCAKASCGYPRWRDMENHSNPYKQFMYFPLIPRLKQQYRCQQRAKILQEYPRPWSRRPLTNSAPENITDWWSGIHYRQLRRDRMFTQATDIAIQMSLDDVGILAKGPPHKCCPVIILVNNLPPAIRFHKWNTLLSLIIPGPNEHGDTSSFLFPLIEELQELHGGVDCINGTRKQEMFTLRAWMVTVTGDGPAITKVSGMKRPGNAKSPCRFCNIKGTPRIRNNFYAVPNNLEMQYNPTQYGGLRSHLRDDIIDVTNGADGTEAGM